ncbi:MAG: YceD family protein [Verrucomicrobia bacterium]|jgi:uncharacterized metal-binding protein YceD (DUF177 family)|nr:YceD family protein [Verrucomicrobiota bacterium]
MPLVVNLRHLANQNVRLQGELPTGELDLETYDEMIRVAGPVSHDLEAQLLDNNLLVRGSLRVTLACQCVRCLKPFACDLNLAEWTCLLPLKGEECVPVSSDCVDLTPHIREDILLAFPQHPVCDSKCRGLARTEIGKKKTSDRDRTESDSAAWSELDKLKL